MGSTAKPAEVAAKQFAWQLETQTSIDLEVTTSINPLGEQAQHTRNFTSTIDYYIETTEGQRFFEMCGINSGAVVNRSVHFGDRGKYTEVNYRMNDTENQEYKFVTNHFWMEDGSDRRQVPQPLLFFYVGRKPLHEVLPKAEYLGADKCLDRECDLFLFKQMRWFVVQDQVFYLEQENIPLKSKRFLTRRP